MSIMAQSQGAAAVVLPNPNLYNTLNYIRQF